MSISRKEFLKQTAMLATGTAALPAMFSRSIQKAFAIDPEPGSSFMDAEHVVFLMQENRSFDHCFGSLKGVRGFNDPRAINLANGNPVWFQTDEKGDTYAPFRLDIKHTKATWMNGLPHGRTSQVAARNQGKYDKWLEAKKSGHEKYKDMPLTMGHYNRKDLPFYYALADAFTVCDQNFCSSLTGTSPNRLYFWTGTVRKEQNRDSEPHLFNGDIDYKDLRWETFPERLEKHGIDWRVYQNELSIPVGFEGKQAEWLANFTDNDLEYFGQYNVRLHKRHLQYLHDKTEKLKREIEQLKKRNGTEVEKKLTATKKELQKLLAYREEWNQERYEKLSDFEKSIHERAFTTNAGDPDYHKLERLSYYDDQQKRELLIPKGDILRNFREDVKDGNLPTVSWLVAPENFSDHPSAPWFGAWYVSEVLNILTQNPEVWKKTIFVITYDENDGYFDHIPPFVAPNPEDPHSGAVSEGINNEVDYAIQQKYDNPIGLGYRVPKLVVSPWSRGGWVNSEVLDHTSDLQFLEKFLSHKMGEKIQAPKISDWRRAVCGDMTSAFRSYNGETLETPDFLDREKFIQQINNAKFKNLPTGYRKFSKEELDKINGTGASYFSDQESGNRPSYGLPYQLELEETLDRTHRIFHLEMEAKNELFGKEAAGSPFLVYAPSGYRKPQSDSYEKMNSWNYAVKAGESLKDNWPLKNFVDDQYLLQVFGPNGFFRQYKGNIDDPFLDLKLRYQRKETSQEDLTGNIELVVSNNGSKAETIIIKELAYNGRSLKKLIEADSSQVILLNLTNNKRWYDFMVSVKDNDLFERKYAGRVETGTHGYSDPQMDRSI